MKSKYIIIFYIVSIIIASCCNQDDKEAIPGIIIKFKGIADSDMAHSWIIETAKNDSSIHLDTIDYGLLNHVNDFTIVLLF